MVASGTQDSVACMVTYTHRYLHGDPGAERASTDSAFAIDLDLLRHITVSIFGFEDT